MTEEGGRHEMAVALGANLGDRRSALRGAVHALAGMGEVVAVSRLYEGPARELPPGAREADRAPYLNAVVRLASHLPPEAVLAACLAHEAAAGRDRGREAWHGARALDLDLLLCDREVRDGPFLRLPHPRLATRDFALQPLADVWPDAPRPGTGGGWRRCAPAGEDGALRAVEGPGWADLAGAPPIPSPGEDLLAEGERRRLAGGPPLYAFGQVGSTADVLRALAAAGAPHGAAVVAERQAAGRGRHGRTWWAEAGEALLLSVLLRDGAALGGLMPLFVGLAVVEAAEAAGSGRLALKWPNDVVTPDGRKVAGVLVERTGDLSALVGVGVNLRVPRTAPPEVRARAAGLADTGMAPPRARLLRHVLARLETLAAEARARGEAALLERWRRRSVTLGRTVEVHPAGGAPAFSGVAVAVADDGALVVRGRDGRERRVHAGEVSLTGAAAPPPG
ncbi:MAG: biotin--[acetyl-CoA-carboxylase] ligase [Firmicutes bacterium]|nr:biotin--[acetyl-CoA-carboxylase] ligase [Bacillota bacterium]